MKELQAVNQQVILEISEWEQEQRTASGIIIPDSAKEKSRMAVISGMSVIDNPEVKIGDRVLFKPYSGNEVEFEGKKYLILPYGDILAKVVETEEI
ncbi:MAG TPA: co-chaperone GroES [Porphyromonadaceae bacterium]|jgi:chaperonin GroES|nr:MAG: molecular chaperone GroES [Bacteroidetes bacterium GWC2_46_850]HBB01270.1 co-chaperone GroES [Porphyromonadaceae bacterium]